MIKGYTFFSKNTGVEIREYDRVIKDTREGKVRLRFFTTDGSKKNLIFMLDPDEAYVLGFRMQKIVKKEENNFSLLHSFLAPDGSEVVSKLICERWERDGKSGFSLVIVRGQERINVALSEGRFLYASNLLKFLAMQSSWWVFVGDRDKIEEEVVEEKKIEEAEENEVEVKTNPFKLVKVEGEVQAVAKSGSSFKVNDSWINLKETTKVSGELSRGKHVEVLVSKSEGRVYAERVRVKG